MIIPLALLLTQRLIEIGIVLVGPIDVLDPKSIYALVPLKL
jgi:hypothetical protein